MKRVVQFTVDVTVESTDFRPETLDVLRFEMADALTQSLDGMGGDVTGVTWKVEEVFTDTTVEIFEA